ncbi:glycosyltransferase family 4 protein [Cellulomonas carbonis]|uniref:D-inositol 3-phosphate glycosyltransferase n=1 Tax=Cellulomonas carbonis T26 TaxID=947969 RepID=A0A0A0BV49_9CELL|nr:glycosyltransferase family 4 protein [Cellulomonas carbonis]KGM12233.1 glycosyl transferase family 1 [Cellulomonas carbonis T26]GGB96593.1 glycosyl transferase [Cellulomonas carbonis]
MTTTDAFRVLQVLGSSAGGVARHVAQLADAGSTRGWRVVVAGPTGVRDAVAPRGGPPFAPVEITDRPGRGDVGSVRRLRRLAVGADVVHAHGLRAGALVVLAVQGLRRRPRVVVTLHNLPVGSRLVRATAQVLWTVVGRGADVVLGVSGDLVALARAHGARRAERALVPAPPLRPAAPRASTRAALGVGEDTNLLVTVARLAPQKGLDVLCDAAGALDLPDVLWLVAGDGPLEAEVASRVAAERLPVRLLGRRSDVADLVAAADVVVSTARWEGQPLNVQEALALGAPLVATDVGGTAEVTGNAAVLVPPDGGAVAAAVRSLLADDDARAGLGRAAAQRATTLPDLAAVLDQLDRVYRTGEAGPAWTSVRS